MNMVEEEDKQVVVDVNDVRAPIKIIFKILIKNDFIEAISPGSGMQSHGSISTK